MNASSSSLVNCFVLSYINLKYTIKNLVGSLILPCPGNKWLGVRLGKRFDTIYLYTCMLILWVIFISSSKWVKWVESLM
ncbi:hypothetical protein Hanom_Chr04g00376431 [Helianthus anomalus]